MNTHEARTDHRTAKDAAAYVAELDAAMRTTGWGCPTHGMHTYRATLVSIDGTTKSGRQQFTVRFDLIK